MKTYCFTKTVLNPPSTWPWAFHSDEDQYSKGKVNIYKRVNKVKVKPKKELSVSGHPSLRSKRKGGGGGGGGGVGGGGA